MSIPFTDLTPLTELVGGETVSLFAKGWGMNYDDSVGLVNEMPTRYIYEFDNFVHVTELAYTENQQIIWSWYCPRNLFDNQQYVDLKYVQQTAAFREADKKLGPIWKRLAARPTDEWANELNAAARETGIRATAAVLMEETNLGNGVLMTVGHIQIIP